MKDMPCLICGAWGGVVPADEVMKKVDETIEKVRSLDAELEVIRYAA